MPACRASFTAMDILLDDEMDEIVRQEEAVSGERVNGRKLPAGGTWEGETGVERAATRRHSHFSHVSNAAPGLPTGPRVTNLIPHARTTQPRTAAGPRNATSPRLPGDSRGAIRIPRQSSGLLDTAPTMIGRSPIAPAGASSPRSRKTPQPETIVPPALHNVDDDTGQPSAQRRRRTTTTRQTLILNALKSVGEDVRAATAEVSALRNQTTMPAANAEVTPHAPVTLVPTAPATAPRLGRRLLGRRSLVASIVTFLMALGIMLGVLGAVNPLSFAQGGTSQTAPTARKTAAGQPTKLWNTQAGAVLGLGGGAAPGVHAPGSAGLPVSKTVAASAPKASTTSYQTSTTPSATNATISPAPLSPWPPSSQYIAPPGYHPFHVSQPSNGYYIWAFGQCTWWAQYKRQDENLQRMGNAQFWAGGAASRGYRVGSTPVAGATVVFQPGVEGAGGAGHVAHVEKVYPGGWFLVSEMNFYWNGGGWGIVDYRYAYARSGVSFIY